jgi:pimeloyl-ACP methyl ester carboxylesterase
VLALRGGLRAGAAALLAPLADPEEYAGKFANICRMPGPVCDSMKIRLAAREGVPWEELQLVEPTPATAPPLLIFHDCGKLKVPPRDGRAIASAWPGASLVMTGGLGHYKILRSPEVVTGAIAFLLRARPASRPAEAAAGRIA